MYWPSESPESISKSELPPKKVLLSVWCSVEGIIHWDVLPPKQIFNIAFHYLQLNRLWSTLVVIRHNPVNYHGAILYYDNVKPHADVITHQQIVIFG